MKGTLPEAPLLAYCRPPNLMNLLVRAAVRGPQELYRCTHQCKYLHCKTCTHIKMGCRFSTASIGEWFCVKATADCCTNNVVHLIERKYSIQYVRETENALRVRLTGHRLDINHHHLEKPVARHFNLLGHSLQDLTIMVIEKIHKEDAVLRKIKESHWIQTIRSLTPD